MFPSHDQGHAIENLTVHFDLIGEAIECVAVTLQFIATKLTIDDCNIDANGSGPNAHLLHNACRGIAFMQNFEVSFNRSPHICIPHCGPFCGIISAA